MSRARYFIEFRAKLPHFTRPKPIVLKAPIKVKEEKSFDGDEVACLVDEEGKFEIWLGKDRNLRQLCRDSEHEMDHLWGAFIKCLHDAYVDWKRTVLED